MCVRVHLLQEASLSQPKGLVPFFSPLLSDPHSRSPSRSSLSSSLRAVSVFCIVFEFRLSSNSSPSHTHLPPFFCSRFPFFFLFYGCPRKTENIGCAFGTTKTVVGCRGFVPRVSVAHSFDWFVLGCLVVLPSLYDESVFFTEALSFFFALIGECLFIRFCSCGCSMSPSHHESDIQSCFLFSTSFCHLASHAS